MKKRLHTIDSLRGITIFSMVMYHAYWDLVFLFDTKIRYAEFADIWQQSICWSFIFIAGFTAAFKRPSLRRIAEIFAGGAAVTIVSRLLSDPTAVINFGVLTFISSALFTCYLLYPLINERSIRFYAVFTAVSALLFAVSRHVSQGYVGIDGLFVKELPLFLYKGWFMTFLGFMEHGFYSADYFPFIPWVFMFFIGYGFSKLMKPYLNLSFFYKKIPFFSYIGRHSLLIYLVHQPIIYIGLRMFIK
ncbi:MAG: DUF1624 domain-containing protein [Lachnospiraceae bacterium]|nr:DUF1624 domain-containing protein [Lachnospiraceae bacterium]